MIKFTLYDQTNAPEESRPLLETSRKAFGMIPNIHAVMAESAGFLRTYKALHDEFLNSSFDAAQQTVVWQTINVEHTCTYCVPAHTVIAKRMKVDEDVIRALRDGTPLPNERLEALRDFTLAILRERGKVGDATVQAFFDAGYTKRQVFEVVMCLGQKVMSNYINHLTAPPIDKEFAAYVWQPSVPGLVSFQAPTHSLGHPNGTRS